MIINRKEIQVGTVYGDLPIPKKAGYVFEGWYTSKEGGDKIEPTDLCKEDITLYAHWEKELEKPELKSVESVEGGIRFTWNEVEGATRYRAFKKTGKDKWKKFGDTEETSIIANDLTLGTAYTFTVRCISEDGKQYTSGFDATGLSVKYLLPTPELVSVIRVEAGAEITWNPVKGASLYRVYEKNMIGGWDKLGETTETSCIASELIDGRKYTFTVRCFSADGKTIESDYDKEGKSL